MWSALNMRLMQSEQSFSPCSEIIRNFGIRFLFMVVIENALATSISNTLL